MKILGISAYYHDSSATLIEDGRIIFACQEERFSRLKNDSDFPRQSIQAALTYARCKADQIDAVVFYEKPFLKFERLLETYLAFAPRGFWSFSKAIPLWLHEKLFQKKLLAEELTDLGFSKDQTDRLLFSEHHLSHAASAFFASGFEEALVLTMDGVGEWDTTTIYQGSGSQLKKIHELSFPHSLGMLYSAFTYHCGFKVNSGEYKLMGLAPYGKPRFADLIRSKLIDIKSDGSFKLDMKYFDYPSGLKMTSPLFSSLFQSTPRKPEEELQQIHMDLAASVQIVLEEVVIKMCRFIKTKFRAEKLCLAGGVALNCALTGKLLQEKIFSDVWVQPAAGDAGGSLGAALAAYHIHFSRARHVQKPDSMQNASLGPQFQDAEIQFALEKHGLKYTKISDEELFKKVAQNLKDQKVVGWFQGRLEFGPRALGFRSILADAKSSEMQKNLNLKIKFRESFRPFAPVLLEEDLEVWFDLEKPSPYMSFLGSIKKDLQLEMSEDQKNSFGIEKLNAVRSQIPAVTHVDYTSRIQTVNRQSHPRLYELLKQFKKLTGFSVLVNTSLNIRGEPIVCTPDQAIQCFLGTHLDFLVLENYILEKALQPPEKLRDYRKLFETD